MHSHHYGLAPATPTDPVQARPGDGDGTLAHASGRCLACGERIGPESWADVPARPYCPACTALHALDGMCALAP